jgi:hypothetical protein
VAARARRYGLGMDILLYLALWTVPLAVGYFMIRLAVRHGVMDAHRRMHPGEIGRPDHTPT